MVDKVAVRFSHGVLVLLRASELGTWPGPGSIDMDASGGVCATPFAYHLVLVSSHTLELWCSLYPRICTDRAVVAHFAAVTVILRKMLWKET